MSQEITEELLLFFHSFLTGIIMAVFYDGLLIIRRVIRHGQFWISLEDFFFWLICAWGVFLFLVFYDGLQSVELYWEHFFIKKR